MRVIIEECDSYNIGKICQSLDNIFNQYNGLNTIINNRTSLLLKPNLLRYKPAKTAATTHPIFIEAIMKYFRDHFQGNLYLGDSPGLGTASNIIKKFGLTERCKYYNVEITDFKKSIKTSDNKYHFKNIEISDIINRVDGIINIPKLKTHVQMGLTLCVKNMFGMVVGLQKPNWHLHAGTDYHHFAKLLLSIYYLTKPIFNIVDGIYGMECNGPGSGNPIQLKTIFAGDDGVVTDYIITQFLGVFPEDILTIQLSEEYSKHDFNHIDYDKKLFDKLSPVLFKQADSIGLIPWNIPKFLLKFLQPLTTNIPKIIDSKCIRCGECMNQCPTDAMHYKRNFSKAYYKTLKIRYNKCISCFCCHEICPNNAIDIKTGILLRLSKMFTSYFG